MRKNALSFSAVILALALVFCSLVAPVNANEPVMRPESNTNFGAWYEALVEIFSDDNFAAYVANAFTRDDGFALASYSIEDYPTVNSVLASYTGNIDANYTGAAHALTQNKLNDITEPDVTLGRITDINDALLLPKATQIDLTGNLIYDLTPLSRTDRGLNFFGHTETNPNGVSYIDTTFILNGNPLTIWPEEFCGYIQLAVNSRSYPIANLYFLNDGTAHSIKVPVAITASGAEGVYIYQPVDPNPTPTGATWTRAANDAGEDANDETSNLLTSVTITNITAPGSFSYAFTTSFASRFLYNKYTSTELTTLDKLTYSMDYPFNVIYYNEFQIEVNHEQIIKLTKTNPDTGEFLSGAVYDLYRIILGDELMPVQEAFLTTNGLGVAEANCGGLEDGEYCLIETVAPETNNGVTRYKIDFTPITFTINSEEEGTGNTVIASENSAGTVEITKEAPEGDSVLYTRDSTNITGYVPAVQTTSVNVSSEGGVFVPSSEAPVITTDYTQDEIKDIVISKGEGENSIEVSYDTLAEANAALAAISNGTSEDFPQENVGVVTVTVNVLTALSHENETFSVRAVGPQSGEKILLGDAINEGDYEFKIEGVNEQAGEYLEEIENGEGGSIDFSEISISATGVYIYKITEIAGDDELTIYDATEYYLIICARADETTRDLVTSEYYLSKEDYDEIVAENPETEAAYRELAGAKTQADISFTNTLKQRLEITAQKSLTGGTLEADSFSFTITGENVTYSETASNNAAGLVSFDNIDIEESGIYIYSIREDEGANPRIIYDDTVYYFIANVLIEDGEGSSDTVYITEEDYNDFITENTEITTENFSELQAMSVEIVGFENTELAPQTGDSDMLMIAYVDLLIATYGLMTAIKLKKRMINK